MPDTIQDCANGGLCRRRQQHAVDRAAIQTSARLKRVKRLAIEPPIAAMEVLTFYQGGAQRLESAKRRALTASMDAVHLTESLAGQVADDTLETAHGNGTAWADKRSL